MDMLPTGPGHSHQQQQQQQLEFQRNVDAEEAPKKRAETWSQEEIRALIALRREMDKQFNTSKSNKHLWEQISLRMKELGFERNATMCTDKWRNLLKEYKKAKFVEPSGNAVKYCDEESKGESPNRNQCYHELDDLLRSRAKPGPYRVARLMQRALSPGGGGSGGVLFESGSPGGPDSGGGGGGGGGRVISVRYEGHVRQVAVDAASEEVRRTIRAVFGLRTGRAFWLADEAGVVRPISADMPQGSYTLFLDPGVTIKICSMNKNDQITHAQERTLYTQEEFGELLKRRKWSALAEVDTQVEVDSIDQLRPASAYKRVAL